MMRRAFTWAVFVGVTVVAFLIALGLGMVLPFPWGSIIGIVCAAAIGYWAGRFVLWPLRQVERRRHDDAEPVWERCAGPCGREYLYPHLCRRHMLCGLCHPPTTG
jgi:hypothetical protein